MKKTLFLLLCFLPLLSFGAPVPRAGGVEVLPLTWQVASNLVLLTNIQARVSQKDGVATNLTVYAGITVSGGDAVFEGLVDIQNGMHLSASGISGSGTNLAVDAGGNLIFTDLTFSSMVTNNIPVLTLTNLNLFNNILPVVNNSGSWGSASFHPSLIYGRNITASNSVNAPFGVFTSLSAGDTIVAGTLTAASIGTNFASIVSLAGFDAAGRMYETALSVGGGGGALDLNDDQFLASGGVESIRSGVLLTNVFAIGNGIGNALSIQNQATDGTHNIFQMIHTVGDSSNQTHQVLGGLLQWVEDWQSNKVVLAKHPVNKIVETLQQREAGVWRRNFHFGTVQASTVYTNNTVAPTAAALGANAGQLQVSNGVWYLFSTPDGSALNTIKLGP